MPSQPSALVLHGVDLVDMFDEVPAQLSSVTLESASVSHWQPAVRYDLITCVHGLHYVGDKLAVVERAAGWLKAEGLFAASLDLANLQFTNGRSMARDLMKRLRTHGFAYDRRRHVLSCEGTRNSTLGYHYIGADDTAGPNYSGQDAVDSYYAASE